MTADAGSVMAGATGPFEMPVAAFLVEHERGTLVFDTGMHPELVDDTARLGPIEAIYDIDLEPESLLAARLGEAGLAPDDVDLAVCSHLHFDHGGGLGQLPDARLVVQRAEWEAAADPLLVELGVYDPADVDLGHDRQLLDGDHDVFGDGSVRLVATPGHTAGHQSLLVEGRLLLIGDACYCRAALDADVLPPFAADEAAQRAGFARLRRFEAEGVTLVFSHDADQWATLGPEL